MAHYIIRETVTLLYYIEADSPAAAIEKSKDIAPRDFDEIDCSPRGANKTEVEIDPDYEGSE